MRRLALTLCVGLVAVAVAGPASAQETPPPTEDTTTSTSTPPTTAAPTTQPPIIVIPGITPTTAPTTTTTTIPDATDPVGHVDAPSEEVPITDATVPPGPGQAVNGQVAAALLRRELTVARAEAAQSAQLVSDAATKVDELEARLASLQSELATLDVAQTQTVDRLESTEALFRERVADAIVRGNAAELDTLFTSENAVEVFTRNVLLGSVAEADQNSLHDYRAAKAVVEAGVLNAVADVAATRRELRDARKVLETTLAENAQRRFELAVFAAGSEIVIRGFVFPVGKPYTFIDSWGFPRMTGTEYSHGHQGVDIMAPFGTPLYATERGVVTRTGRDVLGGTKVWLKGQSGTYYYYAHLQSYAEGIVPGLVVEAGTVLGFVGDTGNAKGGAPHLHFEIHPGGGAAVNPYGLLKVVSDLSSAA